MNAESNKSTNKDMNTSYAGAIPVKQGLYDPEFEKDACGVGFIVNIKGIASNAIVSDARQLLCNMTHRGAVGANVNDGDGAGVMTGIPHELIAKYLSSNDLSIPRPGEYATGNVFFCPDESTRKESQRVLSEIATNVGLSIVAYRPVPTQTGIIGPSALSKEPLILQPIVILTDRTTLFTTAELEHRMYLLRKQATHRIGLNNWFYICSLTSATIVYKGQLSPAQVYPYFSDLVDPLFKSHFCVVHSRFSTNTFPSWDRAQPMRWIAHNGEINTLRGNKNWMRSREGIIKSESFNDIQSLFPIIENGGSDSSSFDNVLDLLVVNGTLSLPQAVMMMGKYCQMTLNL